MRMSTTTENRLIFWGSFGMVFAIWLARVTGVLA